ncbi:MAG TPA: DUF433 domain-containing protein [Verrucomicrobiae bacterium]|jgi:uncharacterized protein (DUF433 family)
MKLNDVITMDPAILHGTPVFRGTRVPVTALFKYLETDHTLGQFVKRYPTVSRRMARLMLDQVCARFASRTGHVSRRRRNNSGSTGSLGPPHAARCSTTEHAGPGFSTPEKIAQTWNS